MKLIASLGAAILCLAVALPARAAEVLVFAAASLQPALDEIDRGYREHVPGTEVKVSYAASGTLAKQIENGAPASLFISADTDWMDDLAKKDLIVPATRADLLGNALVLVAPKGNVQPVVLKQGVDLLPILGPDGRLAIGDPQFVPAGKYAQASLTALGAWPAVQSRLALADNVRAALALVERGEAPLGIVYRTDAISDSGVSVVGEFPADSHPPITYPAAILKANASPDALAYLAWLRGSEAAAVFQKRGFSMLVTE
jgi:molybdate transport system substrate-binding protein